MAPFNHLARGLVALAVRGEGKCRVGEESCLDNEGKQGIKFVVPAVIGGIFAVAILCMILLWGITRCRSRKREKEFWKRAEVRNSLRNSRAMALAEQGSIVTRDSVATLSTMASGVSGPQVYDAHLIPSMPSERTLRASMMSSHSSYSSPYDSSPLSRSATASRIDDPWDARSDADPGEAVPMLGHNRSPRPSLSINTGSNNPPAYDKTYMISHEYPQVEEPADMRDPEPMNSPARAAAVAAAAAQLEGHDYEYAQAAANAAAAAAALSDQSSNAHEVVRSDGGHVRNRNSTIIQVVPSASPVRQKSVAGIVGEIGVAVPKNQ